jgi:hypothetical protein
MKKKAKTTYTVTLIVEHKSSPVPSIRKLCKSFTTLRDAFLFACITLKAAGSSQVETEELHFIRVEQDGELIALAEVDFLKATYNDGSQVVIWRRNPTEQDIAEWMSQMNDQIYSAYCISDKDPKEDPSIASSRVMVRLTTHLLDTRSYALPLDQVYPTLYQAEAETGLQYARADHLQQDIGL